MKEFKFHFLNGFYLVVSDDDKSEDLEKLLQVQEILRSLCPHREREIDSFVLSVCNEISGIK